jgi:hypothetical protein
MKRLMRLRVRPAKSATCFCDACATVSRCDASDRMDAIRQDALTRSFYLRPS